MFWAETSLVSTVRKPSFTDFFLLFLDDLFDFSSLEHVLDTVSVDGFIAFVDDVHPP